MLTTEHKNLFREERHWRGREEMRTSPVALPSSSSSSIFLSHPARSFVGSTCIPFSRISVSPCQISEKSGRYTCAACQTSADFFPSEVVVREARVEDSWEVADTHCSSFYPNYTFPLDILLRINRFIGMLNGITAQSGPSMMSCLVAVRDQARIGGLDAIFGFNRGYVAGVITVDNVAEFLPRKGPFKQRRKGIAYISNVAVREGDRRKGIAKMLVCGAESLARGWGCRSIALHCDSENIAAVRLYESQGFKSIQVPENAKWPQPRAPPGTNFRFMMKLLK